jgi:hypothetical protein
MRWVLVALASILLAGPAPAQVVLVASFGDSSVRRYDYTTGTELTPLVAPGGGGLSGPSGMALGPDGLLYVSSQVNDQVLRFNPLTGAAAGSIAQPAGAQPAGLEFGPDGNLYVSHFGTGQVVKYNPASGAPAGTIMTGLSSPGGLAFRGNTLYAGNLGGGNVQQANFDGTGQSVIVTPGSGGMQTPISATVGPDGNLYVADLFGSAIRKYDPLGTPGSNSLGDFNAGPQLAGQFPSDVIFDGGFAWVANLGTVQGQPTGTVMRFNALTGAYIDTFASNIVNASTLVIVPVPEPSALVLLGGVAAAWRVVRRRKSS